MTHSILTCAWLLLAQPAQPVEMPAPFTAAKFREHVAYLASDELEGRSIGSAGSGKAMEYIIRHLKAAGAKGLAADGGWYQDFAVGSKEKITARNVLGVIPGKGALAKEAVIVSAHHDHLGTNSELVKEGKDGIFNGADDNASGCAALLLVAEALKAERLPESYRTVIFASFDAEELGLLGSRHYVQQPLWPLEKTTANINFDMVGRLHHGKVLAIDSESSTYLVERVTALAAQCGIGVDTRLHGVGRADSASFIERAIPALQFNTGLHSDYHKVSDEVGKIDAAGGARISWLAFRLLREMMDNPQPLRFRRPPPNVDLQVLLRLLLRLGFVPEQNAQVGNNPVLRIVLPNSLASKQGFQANDEILSVNGKKFEGMVDAIVQLSAMRFDRDLAITVQRKGEKLDMKIPAAALKDFAGPSITAKNKDQFEVQFRYKPDKKADTVSLAGTFNNWDVKTLPMAGPDADGFYTIKQTLARGIYEYKFVVGGKDWVADPTNIRTTGTTGNSLLVVE